MPDADRPQPALLQKIEARRESYKEHGRIYRAAWVTAGVIVVAAGIAMVVFPGPAVIVIPIGLAMLSFEFAWAQKLLDQGVTQGTAAKDRIVHASRREKELGALAVVLAVVAVVWVAIAVLT